MTVVPSSEPPGPGRDGRWLRACARYSGRHYRLILVLSLVLTAGSGWCAWRLAHRLQTDMAALLPSDAPSVVTLERIKARIKGTESLSVVVTCPDSAAGRRFAADLAADLADSSLRSYIKGVSDRRDLGFARRTALLYADLDSLRHLRDRVDAWVEDQELKASPFYVPLDDDADDGVGLDSLASRWLARVDETPYFANRDGTVRVVQVEGAGSTSDLGFARGLVRVVTAAAAGRQPAAYHPQLQVDTAGTYRSRVEEYDVIVGDITSTLGYGVAGVVLVLALYFRQLLAALFVTVPLVMGLLWAFGITYFVIGTLNTVTGFLFAVLFGIGIDFGIHLYDRYVDLRADGMPVDVALEEMVGRTGRAVLTSGVTTAVAFFGLTITEFKGFSEFGFIVGTGTLAALLAMFVVLPAALVLADREWGLVRPLRPWGWGSAGSNRPLPRAGAVLGLTAAATLALTAAATRLEFEWDFGTLRAERPQLRALRARLDDVAGLDNQARSPSVVLADSPEDLEQIVAQIEARRTAQDATPTIRAVRTLATAVPTAQAEKLQLLAHLRARLQSALPWFDAAQRQTAERLRPLLEVGPVTVEDLPDNVRKRFIAVDGQPLHLGLIYPSVPLRDGRNAMAFADDVAQIELPSGKVYRSSSANIVFADMMRVLLRDSRLALALTGALVALIVLLDLRSLRGALLVLAPLACGLAWTAGVMALLGTRLNLYNMVVLPAVLGLGIDNGVHLYHRYIEEGPGSLRRVLRSTGRAMGVCVLTTMIGFGGLVTARHPGLNSMGVLALLGLAACFAAAVLLLPMALQWAETRRTR